MPTHRLLLASRSTRRLFTRHPALRLSLLLALGVIPGACGGSSSDPQGGTAGAPSQPSMAGTGAGVSGSTGLAGNGAVAGSSDNGGSSNAGAAAQGGAAGRASGGAGGQPSSPGCVSPHVDAMTGLTVCGDGVEHRPAPVVCTYSGAGAGGSGGGANPPADAGAGGQGTQCKTSQDCAGLKYGYCEVLNGHGQCRTGCLQDSDCQATQVCLCSGPGLGGRCADTHCQVDADCGAGSLCATTRNGCGPTTLACTDPADECRFDKDCTHGDCMVIMGGHRVCATLVCGSPIGAQ